MVVDGVTPAGWLRRGENPEAVLQTALPAPRLRPLVLSVLMAPVGEPDQPPGQLELDRFVLDSFEERLTGSERFRRKGEPTHACRARTIAVISMFME